MLTKRLRLSPAMVLVFMLFSNRAAAEPAPRPVSQPASQPAAQPASPKPAATAKQKPAPPSAGAKVINWLVEHVRLGALWYLHYGGGEKGGEKWNRFWISRGYTTIVLRPVDWFEARTSLDIHEEEEGWEVRLKYLYAKFRLPVETVVVSHPYIEFGLAHIPWLDYEEHINRYRMQGTMFLERNKLFNSADLGITVGTLLGRILTEEQQKKSSRYYPGTWGSVALGIYNGGGYHNIELNRSKVFMMRLSARPGGGWFPGLQLSYMLIYGKGNNEDASDWVNHLGFASFQQPYFTLAAQFGAGEGNQQGTYVNPDGSSQPFIGASGFGELKLPWIWSSLFARYDWFRWDKEGVYDSTGRVITGLAFWFWRDCALVVDLDYVQYLDRPVPDDWQVKATVQVKLP